MIIVHISRFAWGVRKERSKLYEDDEEETQMRKFRRDYGMGATLICSRSML